MPRDEKRGQFARASWGIDYHHILQDRLQKLIAFIEEQAPLKQKKNTGAFGRKWILANILTPLLLSGRV